MTPEPNDALEDIYRQIMELQQKARALRQQIPDEDVGEFTLRGPDGAIRLSALIDPGEDMLVVHNMGKDCAYCTLWADGFNGLLAPIEDRTQLFVVSPDEPDEQARFARSRDWGFDMLSDAEGDFTRAMGYLDDDGHYLPGVSAFHRRPDGTLVRTGRDVFGPGDNYCSVWHLFELLPAKPWQPRIDYDGG